MKTIKEEVIDLLTKTVKLSREDLAELLETPSDSKLGDLALPCFHLSKALKKDPKTIASEIREKIKLPKGLIREVKATGPYLNFFFEEAKLAESTLKRIWKERKGYGYKRRLNKTVVVEFPAPNTNKPLHLGHLRNMSLGESVSRLLETQGYRVVRVNLNNDRGVHICKSMLAYKKWGDNKEPDKKSDHFVGDFYVMFSQKAKEHPELEREIQEMLIAWEAKDPETIGLWRKMNCWALDGFNETYKRFGVSFDKVYYESRTYEKGKEMILEGLKKGIFYKDESGAILADLGELGKKILLRADGTSVYITQDIYLAKLKYDEYHYEKSIYVVASEQNYHFRVLFKILKMLGFKFADKCYHLSYGMVYLPSGRMKSREGSVVDADNLMDELDGMAEKEVRKRHKLKETEVKNLSEKIGLAALKYFLLRCSANKDFVFKPEESISFEGDTGPYLQYSLVRAKKIQQKAGTKPTVSIDFTLLNKPEEIALIKRLGEFPGILEKTAGSYSPHILTEYAFKLATLFSQFYEGCQVIAAESEELKKARLLLVNSYYHVQKSCLNLLGIEEVGIM